MEFKEIQRLFTIDFPENNAKELIAIENKKYNNNPWHPETLYSRLNALEGVDCVDYDTNLCFSIDSEKNTPETHQKIIDIFQDVLKMYNLMPSKEI